MSNFKNYLQLIQESNQHVINEDPITGVLSVVLFYILGTIIHPNPGHPLYNKETATVEEIKKIEKEAPKIIESIDNSELTKAFEAELAELRAKKAKMEKEEQDLITNYNRKKSTEFFAKNRLPDSLPDGQFANLGNNQSSNSYKATPAPTSKK